MNLHLAVLPGDGVGPEVVAAGLETLRAVAERFDHQLEVAQWPVGWAAVVATGDPLPDETLQACLAADAVLMGAVGHPAADEATDRPRPEAGLLKLRKELGCFANLRPARISPHLIDASPLRPEIADGTDLVFVRELAGGAYYGASGLDESREPHRAFNTMSYDADEIRRVARVAFELARTRRGDVVSVDKANVLVVSRLWRRVIDEVAADYPAVRHRHMLVDRAAMELVFNPRQFDVIVTGNLFGDILSDQASSLAGSIGVLGSASIGGRTDLYEPVHGSAPDIAGQDLANPIGTIASVAMMLRHTFGLEEEARTVDEGVERVLAQGLRTRDLATRGTPSVKTTTMAAAVASAIRAETPRPMAPAANKKPTG